MNERERRLRKKANGWFRRGRRKYEEAVDQAAEQLRGSDFEDRLWSALEQAVRQGVAYNAERGQPMPTSASIYVGEAWDTAREILGCDGEPGYELPPHAKEATERVLEEIGLSASSGQLTVALAPNIRWDPGTGYLKIGNGCSGLTIGSSGGDITLQSGTN